MAHPQDQYKAWFLEKIEFIPTETSEILERYSGISRDEVTEHVERVFLTPSLTRHPLYPEVLSRARSGQNVLDIGCCFGTDLRKLIVDGASSENVFGIDIEQGFLDQSHVLFRDADKVPPITLVAENMLNANLSSSLQPLVEKMDIIYMAKFLHLFDIDQQHNIMRKAVKLLRRKPDSMIIGSQIGNVHAGSYPHRVGQYPGTSYYHNTKSFQDFM
ncbi:MAG: hypothetical protein Q9162_006860 [Coniocarpon cinnabarinum]